jgi:hypothetical protein
VFANSTYWRSIQNHISHSPIVFKIAQLHSNRFLLTRKRYSRVADKFSCTQHSLNSLLTILKTILELEEWTNWNQEFSHWANRKRQGPQINLVDVSPNNVISPIYFHLNREKTGNDDI